MDFLLTKAQQETKEHTRQFAQQYILPYTAKIDADDIFPMAIIRNLAEAQLMGLPIPKELGGAGLDFSSYILALEEISKASATVGVILAVHTSVATMPILIYGTPAQQQRYVIPMAQGSLLGAFALTEQSAGSDASQIKTRAYRAGEEYIVTGNKIFITNLGAADIYILFAVTNPDLGIRGISAFILEKEFAGVEIGKFEKKMGLHGSNTGELILRDVRIPKENLLGHEGQGYEVALANLAGGRIGIGAQALGIAGATVEYLIEYISKVKLSSEQLYAHKTLVASCATNLEAASLLVYSAAAAKQINDRGRMKPAMAKMFASDMAVKITESALNIAGHEPVLQRYFRDAKVTQIYEGTNEIQRIVIAKEINKKYQS